MQSKEIGKKVLDISKLLDVFQAQDGEILHLSGKIGNGKTYEATRWAIELLEQGQVVYTSWNLILPEYYDERNDWKVVLFKLFFRKKTFYRFNYKENWKHIDIDRPDLAEFVATLTDCFVFLDEGQDIFDSYEGRGLSLQKRKSLTRTRHLRKTLVIISQRPQAVAVTARANVTYFLRCVKTRAWFWPFKPYFKVYRTEELDTNNFPIWETEDWSAPLVRANFADTRVFNSYNSWYLREGIEKSQKVNFEAYDLNIIDKIKALFRKKEKVPLAQTYEELVENARKKQAQWKEESKELTKKPKKAKISEEVGT